MHVLKYARNNDFIHAHWLIPQGITASYCNKPYLVTGHGGDVGELNKHIFYKLKKRCLNKASAVTVVSAHLNKILQNLYGCRTANIIPMGCNTAYFNPSHRINNMFEQGNQKVVLFVGRLAEKKGVAYLIKAMQHVDAKLVIAGSGPLERSLKESADQLGLASKIIFLGPKNHLELKNIYASADIFVAPSITAKSGDIEGFGLVILEAMASGLPVIASNSGGITDIIQHGVNGMLAEEKNSRQIGNFINQLLEDKEYYEKLSSASLKTAEAYDYSVIADQYHTIIENSLA